MNADSFQNIATEVNVYFYNHTYEEIVKLVGNDAWFKFASEKVTFYFKDTMPEDVELPEGSNTGSGGSSGGGVPIGPGVRPLQ